MSDIASIVFLEILIRVPPDSLPRLRCVCRELRRLIDHPDFQRLHIRRQSEDEHRLIISTSGNLYSLSLSPLQDSHNRTGLIEKLNFPLPNAMPVLNMPVPCCHGLMLLCHFDTKLAWTVWNPYINHFLELPPYAHLTTRRVCSGGIGYDAVIGNYKVVRISGLSEDAVETLIYSVKSDMWSKLEDYPNCILVHDKSEHGVFFNHALHWFASIKLEGGGKVGRIISLDLGYEQYYQLSLPPGYGEHDLDNKNLDALGGCLVVSYSYRERFDVWMLNDLGGGEYIWKMFVSLDRMYNFGTCLVNPRLISYSKSKKEVAIIRNEDDLLWYNAENKCWTKVCVQGIDDGFSCQAFSLSYIQLNGNSNASGTTASVGSLKRKRTIPSDRFASKLKTLNYQITSGTADCFHPSDAEDCLDPSNAAVSFDPSDAKGYSVPFDQYDTKGLV